MAALDFPNAPADDETFGVWVWSDTVNAWRWNVVPSPYEFEYLVVAGGGAGGCDNLNNTSYGGGGAGGALQGFALKSQSDSFTVTVGAGGSGINDRFVTGGKGGNSSFESFAAEGGGGGGSKDTSAKNGANGGSGGGAAGDFTGGTGGLGTSGQGNDGGDGASGGQYERGGGGGGASGTGEDNTGGLTGTGGTGIISDISGSSTYYSVGGHARFDVTPAPGFSTDSNTGNGNTGGGGGGAPNAQSGVVVLKYPSVLSLTVGAGLTSSTVTSGAHKITTFTAGTDTITVA